MLLILEVKAFSSIEIPAINFGTGAWKTSHIEVLFIAGICRTIWQFQDF